VTLVETVDRFGVERAGSFERLLSRLQCPTCRSPFAFAPSVTQPLSGGVFGVLSCRAHAYPVVDSIPVIREGRIDVQDHTTHKVDVVGPSVPELIEKVGRDPIGALVDLLAFPPALPFELERYRVPRKLADLAPTRLTLLFRRRQVRAWIEKLDDTYAQDWLGLCYLRSRNVDDEYYRYFLTKFSQPRFIASLALASVLRGDEGPVLDVACGFGHLIHHLAVRPQGIEAVGVDRNFFQLWVGRRFIARSAAFVCADAALPLPFASDAFSASLCSDAFHLLPEQRTSLLELRRCARAGTVVLDRVGNGLLEPRDVEWEASPQGYVDVLGGDAPWRMVAETELIDWYLAGRGPRLAVSRGPESFEREKWLSIVTSEDRRVFVDHELLPGTLHGAGPLGLNPMYAVEAVGDDVRLRFEFPSTWHAFENAAMTTYHAWGLTLPRQDLDAALTGQAPALADELVQRFVLIGMPETYLRPTGT
jgi:SAM-dependent methyltransferase/uncharacterized protein YbaR (Trm112 family)